MARADASILCDRVCQQAGQAGLLQVLGQVGRPAKRHCPPPAGLCRRAQCEGASPSALQLQLLRRLLTRRRQERRRRCRRRGLPLLLLQARQLSLRRLPLLGAG
jgi:hypothetical protein